MPNHLGMQPYRVQPHFTQPRLKTGLPWFQCLRRSEQQEGLSACLQCHPTWKLSQVSKAFLSLSWGSGACEDDGDDGWLSLTEATVFLDKYGRGKVQQAVNVCRRMISHGPYTQAELGRKWRPFEGAVSGLW